MKKTVVKKVLSLSLAFAIMVSCALFVSINNTSVGNALTGLSGGTALQNTQVFFQQYTGTLDKYSDGSTRRAYLSSNYATFTYQPTSYHLIAEGPEIKLTDESNKSVTVYGNYGTCSFNLPHQGKFRLIAQVKDKYGYVYSRIIYIYYYKPTGITFTGYSGQVTSGPDGSSIALTCTSSNAMFEYSKNVIESTLACTGPGGVKSTFWKLGGYVPGSGYVTSNAYTVSFPVKGTYNFTCSVKDTNGRTYQISIPIVYK